MRAYLKSEISIQIHVRFMSAILVSDRQWRFVFVFVCVCVCVCVLCLCACVCVCLSL